MASSKILNAYVPHISRASFDEEASAFLSSYYPEALEAPMAVPIEEVAKKKLGILVIEKRLTEDFSGTLGRFFCSISAICVLHYV